MKQKKEKKMKNQKTNKYAVLAPKRDLKTCTKSIVFFDGIFDLVFAEPNCPQKLKEKIIFAAEKC